MQHYFVNTKIDNYFLFDKETNHHLNNVMRIKNKEELICVYEEVFYLCEIEINNKELKAIIKGDEPETNEDEDDAIDTDSEEISSEDMGTVGIATLLDDGSILWNLPDGYEDFIEKVWIDVALPFGYITEALINEFKILEPFGKGNTKPVFAAKNVTVLDYRVIGSNANVLKMTLKDEAGTVLGGICFSEALKLVERIKTKGNVLSILYYPDINEYNGNKSIQIVVTDYR